MRLITFFVILLIPCMGFAEGPPVGKDGNVFVDHVVFELTDEQLRQVETRRIVEFTPSQHKYLKALKSYIPSAIPVVPATYNNCTCEFFLYGIWNRSKQIALPLFLFDSEWTQWRFDEQFDKWGSDFFVIDSQANIYWQGKKVAKEDVIQIVKQAARDTAFLDLPLMQSPETTSRVKRVLKSLVKEGKKNKIRVAY
jgi:hypothetical protein